MTVMAYYFAVSFMNQYPAEEVGPSMFACDETIRNAKYSSTLQSLAVPISNVEQPIYDMLGNQNFTMNLEFLNTEILCLSLSVQETIESLTTDLPLLFCSNTDGILTASVPLTRHDVTLQIVLDDVQLVSGFRLGISASGLRQDLYTLQELNFRQVFTSPTSTLAQKATIQLAMTKVINETEPLAGGDSKYAGIWYPTFTYSAEDIFITADKYILSANAVSTTITIVMSETLYYIKNVQSPIAKEPEIIFRTLLFCLLCLELCAMTFLIFKLLLIPLSLKIYQLFRRRSNVVVPVELNTMH